ncbi:MAG: leucyl aminopeptidase [Acidobacteria bacterium]|nr:leucyl aminopeptidase [Acidobacteriota bacterium]
MKISTTNAPAAELESEALILAIPEDADKPTPWEAVDAAVGGIVSDALTGRGFEGKRGQTLSLSTPGGRSRELVLVGLGPSAEIDLEVWRRAVAAAATKARQRGNRKIAVPLPEIDGHDAGELAAAATEATILTSYRYREFKAAPAGRVELREVLIAAPVDVTDATERAHKVADATSWARDLVNTPSNEKRPDAFAALAVDMAADAGLNCEVIDDAAARELGLNALLAVGDGSAVGPRLVLLEHRPAGAEGPPTVIVGKGITFDTGGISLKPPQKMADMKSDMAGAAAVYGTMRVLAELDVPRRVVGVTPLAENMPSSAAYRPGDIIRAYDGTTIEVVNTDAEGRVVLADALAYARKHYEPRCMVDLATLTGACVVALGSHAAGLMGTDDELCDALVAAGEATGERLWRLPAWREYDEIVDSEVANVRNSAGRAAGVVTAGMFLKRFVGDTPWAHLDIAGTAFLDKATPYQPKGGTGFGVRLLTRWLTA